jgi:hypothetical protein
MNRRTKPLTVQQMVLRGLQARRGTPKVTAALGELLAADAMVNLCSFWGLCITDKMDTAERERRNALDRRARSDVKAAWTRFEEATDVADASRQLIPVLLSAAKDLRSLVAHIDFYDDEAVRPTPPSELVSPDASEF